MNTAEFVQGEYRPNQYTISVEILKLKGDNLTDCYARGIVRARWGRGVAGLTRGPVTAETAGPNPVVPAPTT